MDSIQENRKGVKHNMDVSENKLVSRPKWNGMTDQLKNIVWKKVSQGRKPLIPPKKKGKFSFEKRRNLGENTPKPIPVSKVPNQFHGNYGGIGNKGGEPIDKLDSAFKKHDTGYYYTPNAKHRLKHDKALVKAANMIRKDKTNSFTARLKAELTSLYFGHKLTAHGIKEADNSAMWYWQKRHKTNNVVPFVRKNDEPPVLPANYLSDPEHLKKAKRKIWDKNYAAWKDRSVQKRAKLTEQKKSKGSSNDRGILHELLVGRAINGNKHMKRYRDAEGESPRQAHNKIKSQIPLDEYKAIKRRAKITAADIVGLVSQHGKILKVQWTSKPGTIRRATGINASQKEDDSDIVIETVKNKVPKYHGVSLKAIDGRGHAPNSNPGSKSIYGSDPILTAHRKRIMTKYPALKKLPNKFERKTYVKSHPHIRQDIGEMHSRMLPRAAAGLVKNLGKFPKKKLSQHLRTHILKAFPTPMQRAGHTHLRHTTHGELGSGSYTFTHMNPATSYEHILNDPKNIKVHHEGNSAVFSYKGVNFARHRLKLESQSDPLSPLKGSGELIGRPAKQNLKELKEEIKIIRTKGDEDSEHKIVGHNGEHLGSLFRGWKRNGGNQWLVLRPNQNAKGYATLKQAKHAAMKESKDLIGKKTASVEDIVKKHNLTIDQVESQIAKGIKVEREHTNSDDEAREIARDHLHEFPDYYDRLGKMEKKAKKNMKESKEGDTNHWLYYDGKVLMGVRGPRNASEKEIKQKAATMHKKTPLRHPDMDWGNIDTAIRLAHIKVQEDAPANSVGGGMSPVIGGEGNIHGFDPIMGQKPIRRKKFAGKTVFVVNPTTYHKAYLGKRKYEHYEKYLEGCDIADEIRTFGRTHWAEPIILQNEQTGAMIFLKYGSK